VIVKNDIPPEQLPGHLADTIASLLMNHQYDEIADLLDQAQQISLSAHNSIAADLLGAAHNICLTASQVYDEAEIHRQAIEKAQRYLMQLERQLCSVLQITGESITHETNPIPQVVLSIETNGGHQPPPQRSWKNMLSFIKRDTPQKTTGMSSNGYHYATYPVQLIIYCLGTFEVYRSDDELIDNGSSRKALLIFKYLLLNRGRPVRKEVLMDLLWPDSDEQSQRNNLNVAIYSLRQTLRDGDAEFSSILFQNDCYCLNPELEIWTDFEVFLNRYHAAQRLEQQQGLAAAIQEYEIAETLYQGKFLPDDLYEEWLEPQRQLLQTAYLNLLSCLSRFYFEQGDYAACINVLNKILNTDLCFEEAHYRMMRCYSRQGQPYLALRQYDRCAKILSAELDTTPTPETTALYEKIRAGKSI
jgi:DNA-binding SARP family transcriptional activator